MAAPPCNNSTFGLLVPGRPLQFEWQQVGPAKLVTQLAGTGGVSDLVFFLLPGGALPPGTGATLHASFDAKEWTLLGALTADKPSALLRTNWEEAPPAAAVQLGVSLEPLESIQNLEQSKAITTNNDRLNWALHLAQDLFQYLMSFSRATPQGEMIVAPVNTLKLWMERFKTRYRRNPNFVFHSGA